MEKEKGSHELIHTVEGSYRVGNCGDIIAESPRGDLSGGSRVRFVGGDFIPS